jgi:hypothetical protein
MRRAYTPKKLLVASVGVAAVTYAACGQSGVVGNLMPPPPCSATEPCAGDLVCVAGVCEWPCGVNESTYDCPDTGPKLTPPNLMNDASPPEVGDGSATDTGATGDAADGGSDTGANGGDASVRDSSSDANDGSDGAIADAGDASLD